MQIISAAKIFESGSSQKTHYLNVNLSSENASDRPQVTSNHMDERYLTRHTIDQTNLSQCHTVHSTHSSQCQAITTPSCRNFSQDARNTQYTVKLPFQYPIQSLLPSKSAIRQNSASRITTQNAIPNARMHSGISALLQALCFGMSQYSREL